MDEKEWRLTIECCARDREICFEVHDCVITANVESFLHIVSLVSLSQNIPCQLCVNRESFAVSQNYLLELARWHFFERQSH